ncbi:dephospho-CoA kinase [Paenibacillus cymbidii]|uniref:dephospho-CoA kinase n=1 Tax=Paenibacillus cymbidii TaxID=1639034 RepID=UPI001081E99B|nr:dephospho-CoA kinase [Paenibacillus cymbidii]
MNIGLTGGIACGKSTVADSLVRRGALLIDADRIAREVVVPGSPALALVARRFGQAVIAEDGTLSRKKLGDIIFADASARKDLEAILHPAIRREMIARMEQAERERPERLVVVDVPLLYESGLTAMFDEVMVVYVPEQMQLQRLMARDGTSEETARLRIAAQLPIERKKEQADVVIDNSGTLAETELQLDTFWRRKGLT